MGEVGGDRVFETGGGRSPVVEAGKGSRRSNLEGRGLQELWGVEAGVEMADGGKKGGRGGW